MCGDVLWRYKQLAEQKLKRPAYSVRALKGGPTLITLYGNPLSKSSRALASLRECSRRNI